MPCASSHAGTLATALSQIGQGTLPATRPAKNCSLCRKPSQNGQEFISYEVPRAFLIILHCYYPHSTVRAILEAVMSSHDIPWFPSYQHNARCVIPWQPWRILLSCHSLSVAARCSLIRCCEGALQRLQRPCIDIFTYRGPPDPTSGVSIAETMEECKVSWLGWLVWNLVFGCAAEPASVKHNEDHQRCDALQV